MNIHVYAKLSGHDVTCQTITNPQSINNNMNQATPSHVTVLTNQMIVYKHRRVTPRIKNVAKTPKLNRTPRNIL